MKYLIFFLLNLIPFLAFAQKEEEKEKPKPKEYSYVDDRLFLRQEDFHGYRFVPSKGKLTNANFEDPIKLGSVMLDIHSGTVTITERTIFETSGIKGENDSKPYKMGIAKTERDEKSNTYEMVLIDFLNPNIQGYIRFYLNKGYCYKIQFKPEAVASERTFYMAVPPYHIQVRDGKFFTHEGDLKVMHIDSVMGEVVYPFSEYEDVDDYREFTRIYPDDRVSLKFELRKVKKGRKEKSFKYLIINDERKETKEEKLKEFQIKKAKETKYRDYALMKERQCILLTLVNTETKKESKMYLFRNSTTKKLDGIRMGKFEFGMRPGKRLSK